METGGVSSAGRSFCRAASTACKSSSKNEGSFIELWIGKRSRCEGSRFFALRVKGFHGKLSVRLFEQDFHLPLGFFELLLTFTGECDAFFEQFHRFVERELRAFQFADDFLEARE